MDLTWKTTVPTPASIPAIPTRLPIRPGWPLKESVDLREPSPKKTAIRTVSGKEYLTPTVRLDMFIPRVLPVRPVINHVLREVIDGVPAGGPIGASCLIGHFIWGGKEFILEFPLI